MTTIKEKFESLLLRAKDSGISGELAFNCVSGNQYQGNNALILTFVAYTIFKKCTAFLTFKQVEAIGGSVKGQKGFPVFKVVEIIDKDTGEKKKAVKYYTVFNLRQVHRRELDKQEAEVKKGTRQQIDADCYEPLPVPYKAPNKLTVADLESIPF